MSCGVEGVGVRTGAGHVFGACDEGGGVVELDRDFSSGVFGCIPSAVGSNEASMTSRNMAVFGIVEVMMFVQEVRAVCRSECHRRFKREPAIAFAARTAGKCRESYATVIHPITARTNVTERCANSGVVVVVREMWSE